MRRDGIFILVAALLVHAAIAGVAWWRDYPFLAPGPDWEIYSTAKEWWQTGSPGQEYLQNEYDKVRQASSETHTVMWQDMFVLGAEGQILPKHALLYVAVVTPWVGLMDVPGLWLCQFFILIALLFSFVSLWRMLAPETSLVWPLIILFAGTQLSFSLWGTSYDLFGAMLLVGGIALARRSMLLGGAIVALTLFVRPSFVIIFPGALLLAYSIGRTKSAVCRFGIGLAIMLATFMGFNWLIYGGPFTTSYDRIVFFNSGIPFVESHQRGLSLEVFARDWIAKLFGRESGILLWNPALLAALVALPIAWRKRETFVLWAWFCLILYAGFIFSFEFWMNSIHGSRFLLGPILLVMPGIALLIRKRPKGSGVQPS